MCIYLCVSSVTESQLFLCCMKVFHYVLCSTGMIFFIHSLVFLFIFILRFNHLFPIFLALYIFPLFFVLHTEFFFSQKASEKIYTRMYMIKKKQKPNSTAQSFVICIWEYYTHVIITYTIIVVVNFSFVRLLCATQHFFLFSF